MKKIKILLAVITVLTILSTVVFAADSALSFGADTVEYTEGKNLVVSVYSDVNGSIDQYAYFCLAFDNDVWSLVSEGDNRITDYGDGTADITINYDADMAVTKGEKLFDLEFVLKSGAEAVGSEFSISTDGEFYLDGENPEVFGTITVVAADPKPELKNTYKLGDITYTDVPNIRVTKNLASASISGELLIDYLKEEVAYNTSKAFEVVLGAFSGAGDVTFDVALINVPSYVTVTGMDIALD